MGQPEGEFNTKSTNASRRMEMWLTPYCVIAKHADRYFGIPLANVVDFE